jgi:hypothetical protein
MATAPGWPGQNNFGDWWVFPESGTIQNQANPILKQGLDVSGWVGFNTEAEAKAFASGNAVSKTKQAASDVSSSLGTLTDIPKYIAAAAEWIGNRGNWLRIMKVIIGGGLILMGIHHISAVQAVTSTARKVAETAAIA